MFGSGSSVGGEPAARESFRIVVKKGHGTRSGVVI